MHSNIISRLEEYMTDKKLNNNQLTKIAGLSVGLVAKARKTRRGLHSESIEKILNAFPDINPSYLLTGKGEKYRKKNPVIHDSSQNINETIKILLTIIKEKDARIEELNQKIGSLKQQIGKQVEASKQQEKQDNSKKYK
ncbi:hypothetical protein [Anaerophaga thermohalophila]|jgi:hypothetical protein|uniref:hypothetical protein n=1 Tax=Anaerophaga thermohalophila TaxID=177400 RepID=UPI0002EE2105|nr:hypothetical protein [Anaerophaga thermohalophila]